MHQCPIQMLSILATLLLASSVQAADSPTKEQDALIQRERDWAQAMIKQDAKAVAAFEADEYVFTDPNGVVSGKTEDVDGMKSGSLRFTSLESTDMKAIVHSDTGVVVGRQTAKGTFQGQDISGVYRFTDTWIKRDGRWQCVAGQLTRIAKPQ